MLLLPFLIIFILLLVFPGEVKAIIVLPAIILIPIAKLVAVIVASLGLPVIGIGVFIKNIYKKKRLAVIVTIILLVLIAGFSGLMLKIKFPENPLF